MQTLSQFLDHVYTAKVSLAESFEFHLELLEKRLEPEQAQKTIASKK